MGKLLYQYFGHWHCDWYYGYRLTREEDAMEVWRSLDVTTRIMIMLTEQRLHWSEYSSPRIDNKCFIHNAVNNNYAIWYSDAAAVVVVFAFFFSFDVKLAIVDLTFLFIRLNNNKS